MDILVPMDMDELPDTPVPYWAATQEGWFINTPTLFGVAQIKAKKTPEILPTFEQLFRFNDEKLPRYIISQAHDFFQKVWNKQKTESSAYICHHPATGHYKLFVPEQYVTHVAVEHKLEPGQPGGGWQAVGTIHSHCDFSAFHSGTDTHDMGKMPGIHITLGHVDRQEPEIAIALSIADVKFDPIEYDTIIDDELEVNQHGYSGAPDHWLRFVHQGTAPWESGTVKTSYSKNNGAKSYAGYRYGAMHKPTPPAPHVTDYDWSYEYGWGAYQGMQQSWMTDPDSKPRWLVEQEARKKESDDAFKTFDEEVTMAEAEMEFIKERLCMYGFLMNFNIIHNPERAEEYLAKHGKYPVEDLLFDDQLLPEMKNADSAD